jgi:hypothetical protein
MRTKLPPKAEGGRIRDGGPYSSDPEDGPNGAFFIFGPCGTMLKVIASGLYDPVSAGWEHVSVSCQRRIPNWTEMAFVKDLFWEDEELVLQFHPKKSQYKNLHPFCLHMWRWTKGEIPTPPLELV